MHTSEHEVSSLSRLGDSPAGVERDDALLAAALHLTFDEDSLPFLERLSVETLNLEVLKIFLEINGCSTEAVEPSFVHYHHCHGEFFVLHLRNV